MPSEPKSNSGASIKPERKEGEDSAIDDPILLQLRAVYDDVARQPLPNTMLQLLMKLDEAEDRRR